MVEEVFELVVRDFAVIMIVASAMALVSYKLKQPMVIAYIAAGMIIGPHTPPFSLITEIEEWSWKILICKCSVCC